MTSTSFSFFIDFHMALLAFAAGYGASFYPARKLLLDSRYAQ